MTSHEYINSYHDLALASEIGHFIKFRSNDMQFTYTFENFFHPFISELIAKLNKDSLSGMLDAKTQDMQNEFFDKIYQQPHLLSPNPVPVISFPKEIDVSIYGAYANYNWELFFHIPLMIAVHLSKTQRFAEALHWFHYIFDPTTSNDQSDDPSKKTWKFLAFRKSDGYRIADIVRLLSIPSSELSPNEQSQQKEILTGYDKILKSPFQPHAVGRTRYLAYQYHVVMKYLDNLIAWGDHLFYQDTTESINEAIQIYVLAANILGERPQSIPPRGLAKAKTFEQFQNEGLGPIGNALVDLQGQFPFNIAAPDLGAGSSEALDSSPLFGIGRTLFFCIPRNDKLLGYWDTVSDRLFKIRHCMNIAGVVRPLALFDPPIDPGMLVKAAAAGIDVGSIVNSLNQPISSPVRSQILIQKALELCSEVRALGNALLSVLEKGDAEHLALVRQRHEIQIQHMVQGVRFLQWKSTQEATTSLLTSRKTTLERLHYYQRLLGLPTEQNAPDTITLDHRDLTEENFDEAYSTLVDQYDRELTLQKYPALKLAGSTSPAQQSGSSGQGSLYLNSNENAELNTHLPIARDMGLNASVYNTLASAFALIPDPQINIQYWGIGGTIDTKAGTALVTTAKIEGEILALLAGWQREQAGIASRTASYERRADEWLLQYNFSAHELMQIGRQILTSLIAEQIAYHEYTNVQQQIKNAQEIDQLLHDKFTNEDLYLWMQGETSRLFYEYYRFAFDTARKAERTMKQELMRPEVDAQDFVKFNYWDGGRKGLLSGEALYLDVKRMEMAFHENNKREYELTKHVSLRQLNPLALLNLKATGYCEVNLPEWLFDIEGPGHYMRRIKNVSLSIPSVTGPYTSVSCTLSLLKSTVRKSPLLKEDQYIRQPDNDDRFVDYLGAIQSIVTSSGNNDSGLFETNLRDERFLPFEGSGAESSWKLELPTKYRQFDYDTISDVILHIRYTAREGGAQLRVKAVESLENFVGENDKFGLLLLLSLKHDFPNEWNQFVTGTEDFKAKVKRDYFPYFTQGKTIKLDAVKLYAIKEKELQSTTPYNEDNEEQTQNYLQPLTDELKEKNHFILSLVPNDVLICEKEAEVFVVIKYSIL